MDRKLRYELISKLNKLTSQYMELETDDLANAGEFSRLNWKIEELAMELKKKYTVIMVTHNMQQAVRISDQCAFFLLGDLIEFSSTEKMFSMPEDRRTEDYITGRFG